jgi:hypothetical protein
MEKAKKDLVERDKAIEKGDHRLLKVVELHDIPEVSSKLMQIIVPREGSKAFWYQGLRFTGPGIFESLLRKDTESTLMETWHQVMDADEFYSVLDGARN